MIFFDVCRILQPHSQWPSFKLQFCNILILHKYIETRWSWSMRQHFARMRCAIDCQNSRLDFLKSHVRVQIYPLVQTWSKNSGQLLQEVHHSRHRTKLMPRVLNQHYVGLPRSYSPVLSDYHPVGTVLTCWTKSREKLLQNIHHFDLQCWFRTSHAPFALICGPERQTLTFGPASPDGPTSPGRPPDPWQRRIQKTITNQLIG